MLLYIEYGILFVDTVNIHRENYWGGSLRKLWVVMHYKYLYLVSTVSTYKVFDGMVEKPLSLSFPKLFADWKSVEY